MPKTTKAAFTLPKNIQLAFIMTAAIAFVINTAYWILLLLRVYPDGMHLSQFSVWAISIITFPVLMFAIAYIMTKTKASRLNDIFTASLLAVSGLMLQLWVVLVDQFVVSPQLPYTDASFANLRVLTPAFIALAVFVGYLFLIKHRLGKDRRSHILQGSVMFIAGISLILSSIPNVHYALTQFASSRNILDLLTHPAAIAVPVLPIIFFSIAYFTIRKDSHTLNHLYHTTIYTLIGVMVAATTTLLYMIGVWTLAVFNAYPAEPLFDIQTAFVVCVSLLIYAYLVIDYNRAKQVLKKV